MTSTPFLRDRSNVVSSSLAITPELLGFEGEHSFVPELRAQLHICFALIAVDNAGLILWRNEYARGILSAACGIEEHLGRIRIERAYLNRTLQERLQALATDTSETEEQIFAVGVPDRNGRMRYALRLLKMKAETAHCFLIAIVDLVNGPGLSRMAAGRIFNLSPREAELVEFFSQGLNVEEIAPRMGVASNTARIHLRNVFSKTGCSNQIELARVLARTATLVF